MILVAIGANLPANAGRTAFQSCLEAVRALDALPGLRLEVVSRWYASAPVPPSDQPPYVNGIARLSAPGAMPDPATLLAELHRIEAVLERQRSVPNAARTMDLDLVAMGDLLRDAPDPVLPHPRAHGRAFVLLPLRDVAPDWRHPRLDLDANALIARLPPEDLLPWAIRPLDGDPARPR
jgi:2-amino-4-hydroxy-6-hydroxymethyldihydropteridine diphosphokinase